MILRHRHHLARLLLIVGVVAAIERQAAAETGTLRTDQVEFLTADDGLADMVFDLELDARGFLWLATNTHLQRYDGYRFETFRHDPKDPTSPAPGTAVLMTRSRAGGLWLGTQEGTVMRYEPSDDRFVSYLPDGRDSRRLPEGQVQSLIEDERGLVWLVSQSGEALLCRLDPTSGEALRYRHDPVNGGSLDAGQLWSVVEDREGRFWVGTDSGLDRFAPETGIAVHHRWPGLGLVYEDARGQLWTTFTESDTRGDVTYPRDGLLRFDRQRGTFERFSLPASWPAAPTSITRISEDREGALWLSTSRGAIRFDPRSGSFSRFRRDPARQGGLATTEVHDILEDRSGVLWFATRTLGLAKLDRRRERFEVHRLAPSGGGLGGRRVSALEEGRDGTLWIGTDTGLYGLDRESGEIEGFATSLEAGPTELPGQGEVRAILEDRRGTLWVTTDYGGVARLPAGADRFERLAESVFYSPTLFEDGVGKMWVPSWADGLFRFDAETSRLEHLLEYSEAADIWAMHEDADGALWLMTMQGVARLDPREDGLGAELHIPEMADGPTSEVVDLYEDPEGVFWIATHGSGLFRWDRRSDEWRVFGEEEGLSVHVASLLPDDDGMLWVSTKSGLDRFDPSTERFQAFTAGDGLHDSRFLIRSAARLASGELAFGGIGGLTIVSPANLGDGDPVVPPVVLTELRLDGERARVRHRDPASPLERAISEAEELVLEAGYRSFDVEFAALHFANPERNRFAYRLVGFEPDWTATDGEHRRARYTRLAPGDYTFRVKAANPDGLWNEQGASLRIRVLPPWWRTGWAYGLYVLMIAGALYGAWRIQHRKLEAEQEINRRLRQIDRLKDDFLATTSHELRTPLYGMTGLAESLTDGTKGELPAAVRRDLDLIVSSGRRLSSLVDDILDFTKLRRADLTIDLQPVELHSLVDIVLTLSRPLLFDKDLELINAVEADLPEALADENRVQQILHNLVGNAIKFTDAGRVEVRGRHESDTLVIEVLDTGIGVGAADRERIFEAFERAEGSSERRFGGTGLGLAVSRRLVAMHGGELWLESTSSEGSTFAFSLPVAAGAAARDRPIVARAPIDGIPVLESPIDLPRIHGRPTNEQDVGVATAGGPWEGAEEPARILVVDDEPVNRRVLANHLEAVGYRVDLAVDGPQALGRLDDERFDLVLLDVMMPRMSGYEVCRELRRRYPAQELPVVFLTAKARLEDQLAGLAEGANDFLTKPVSREALLARVRTHVELLFAHRKQIANLIPICAQCKKIRDDEGFWEQMEQFFSSRAGLVFSHSLCPSCASDLIEELGGERTPDAG